MVVRAPEETRLEIPPPTEVGGSQGGGVGGQGLTLNAHTLVFAGEHQGPPEGREGPDHSGGLRDGRSRGLLCVTGGEPSSGHATAAAW